MNWFLPAPFQLVSVLFALILVLIAAYWLYRIAAAARQRRRPAVAWWAVPGLMALLLSAQDELPALFGLGAAALLIAEFWPTAYRTVQPGGHSLHLSQRPDWVWPTVSLVVGGILSVVAFGQGLELELVVALGLALTGLGGVWHSIFWPISRQAVAPVLAQPGFALRWNRVNTPEWPALSVTLTGQGAKLDNVSSERLELAGWSPASFNAWLMFRDEQGHLISSLDAGQSAFLPLDAGERGVRVWYRMAQEPDTALLFRADWLLNDQGQQRVLN